MTFRTATRWLLLSWFVAVPSGAALGWHLSHEPLPTFMFTMLGMLCATFANLLAAMCIDAFGKTE